MKKTRNFRLARFTLLLLAGSLCVGRLTAQAGEAVSAGKFTLPFEVRWGQAILPAGDYTYTLNSATFSGVLTVRGNSKAADLRRLRRAAKNLGPEPPDRAAHRCGRQGTVAVPWAPRSWSSTTPCPRPSSNSPPRSPCISSACQYIWRPSRYGLGDKRSGAEQVPSWLPSRILRPRFCCHTGVSSL